MTDKTESTERRTYLAGVAGVVASVVAGCAAGPGSSADDQTTDDTDSAPTTTSQSPDQTDAQTTPTSDAATARSEGSTTEGSAPRSAVAVVRAAYEHMNDGNATAANALVHPDTPNEAYTVTQDQIENLSITVENVSLLGTGEDVRIVQATLRTEAESGEPETVTEEIGLTTYDGAWRLWDQCQIDDDGTIQCLNERP